MKVLPIDRVVRWWRNGNGEQRVPLPPRQQGPSLPRAEVSALPPEIVSPPERAPWKNQWDQFGIPHTLNYPSTTLGRMLDQTAERFGDSLAMRYNHTKRWTYRELRAAVNRLAAGLADLGVR